SFLPEQKGAGAGQPLFLHLDLSGAAFSLRRRLAAGGSRGYYGRSADIDFDLLRLGFLTLGNAQRQNTVLILGLDRVSIHGIRKREAASERAIRALDAQVVLFVHLLLELALTANGEDVVLHANVQILGIDIGEIRLHYEFVLAFVDVDGRRPRAEVGILARTIKGLLEQAIDLVLQGGDTAERFPSSYRSHSCKHLHR